MHAYIIFLSFHWILLIIQGDDGKVDVMDSSLKYHKLYENFVFMLRM
jgi:hypothetical protein